MDLQVLLQISVFCVSLFLFFKKAPFLQRRRSCSASTGKLPPGPAGLPIIGNLHQLGSQPHQTLARMAKLHGHLFTLQLGSITTVVSSSPETAHQILHKYDQAFSNRPVRDAVASQPDVEGTLAWVPGDHRWRNRRRICTTQMFSPQRLDFLQHLRHEKVGHLVAHIRKAAAAGAAVDVGQLAFATSLNLISRTIFSIDVVDSAFESAGEFKELVWRIMEISGQPNLSDYFPVLRWLDVQGMRQRIQPSFRRMHEIFDGIIGERVKARDADRANRKGDFLDVLLDQCQEQGSDLNVRTIKPLILDLFIAGSDTSAITTEWAMAELLRKPETLQNARKELIDTIGTDRSVLESDIERLPYLQAVVKETMRLHPAAPLLLPYIAGNDVEVCGFTIPKGSQVLVNAWAIARDPSCWKDPTSFCPERFLDSSLDYKGHDFEYIPFGAGRRICPGLPLGVRMVNLELASLIHSFHWELPKGTTPESLDMQEQFGITLKKAVPLSAIPSVRVGSHC
ncbi:geraniol 8-hydroxylase-like [Malania oleifera]|uniref:geraniol 8-hydroxylase-like n=1 Tax=Malania oleifera TaxID=397392 RepID=UPI0025ADB4FC|nr:geraniol 8-hydroxylase-like [Malania oleifera]